MTRPDHGRQLQQVTTRSAESPGACQDRILDLGRDPGAVPDSLFETAQVQLSFGDRDSLDAEDREIIRSLGLKYRGRQAWP